MLTIAGVGNMVTNHFLSHVIVCINRAVFEGLDPDSIENSMDV